MEHYIQNIFAAKTFSLQFCIKLSNIIYKVRNIFWKCEKQIQIRYLKAYLRNLTIKHRTVIITYAEVLQKCVLILSVT